MNRPLARACLIVGLALSLLATPAARPPALAVVPDPPDPVLRDGTQPALPVCFWSDQGPVCVERAGPLGQTGPQTDLQNDFQTDRQAVSQAVLRSLLAGPTADERARGLHSVIPDAAMLDEVRVSGSAFTVTLSIPAAALQALDAVTVEQIIQQVAVTLQPLGWRDLSVGARDPVTGAFRALSSYLPLLPAPRKPGVMGEAAVAAPASPLAAQPGQPPASGQGQPFGGLSGRTVYVSAGHGWQYNGSAWRTQRPPYPRPPYANPIIEDHNNAEAVDQYLLAYLWNAGAQVWPTRERDMNGTAVIVNNDAPGAGNAYVESGAWATGLQPGYDFDQPGHTYRYAVTVAGAPTAATTWTAAVPADGRYAVYAWYVAGSNRAADAHYGVHHAGGQTVVLLDQTRHGSTWRYLGTFAFRAADGARITLDNRSLTPGLAVIADAVRVGGGTFDSLAGIDTSAPSPPYKPWWEVSTYYYVQRMGMDQPSNDVVARPRYARWEHAGTGEDALYISWHTNGYNGYQTSYHGTTSYVHNGNTYPATPGSAQLRDAVHYELVHDLRAGWDAAWGDRGRGSLDLGELRELWDSDPSARMPGALIEVAYHDHPGDADALQDPRFNMIAARAIYQGIVKYFEQRDGVDLTLLPEPPTHLQVTNAGQGRLALRWQPPALDTLDLAGDPPTAYRVYTNTDGLGWSDGVPVASTAYTLTGLLPGQLLFVRVASTNAGGESFPTETLGARIADDVPVLLVNGFDRLNRFAAVPETDPVEGYNMRLFLERMNRYAYAVQHGRVISYAFDSAANEAVEQGGVSLGDYPIVDWILGEEASDDETLSSAERSALAAYLNGGGSLFISGSELGWDLVDQGRDAAFYSNYLRAGYAGDDAGTYTVAPVAGGLFDGLGSFCFDAPDEYDADCPDRLTPLSGSSAALLYSGGTGGTAAVQYADGCRRLVNFGFPFEAVRPEAQASVMTRLMGFLGACVIQYPQTLVTGVRSVAYWEGPPAFTGVGWAAAGVQRVEVSLWRESDGSYWSGSSWGTQDWHTAVGTTAWSFPMPPTLEVSRYVAQARAWDTAGISDTTPARVEFRWVILDELLYLPLVLRQG